MMLYVPRFCFDGVPANRLASGSKASQSGNDVEFEMVEPFVFV